MDEHVVVLTGAGISAESGLRTFRASDGLWEEHRIEDVASPEGFARNPTLVHRFYSERRAQLRTVEPNDAHRALADYAARRPGRLTLVTQNVDDLHQRAGSPNVLPMHGELSKVRCLGCAGVFEWSAETSTSTVCPGCGGVGVLRPHIVWFGEVPLFLDEIERALSRATLFVSIGTSGHVYPAAGFFRIARTFGARTVELNLEPSENSSAFDETRYGPATEIVPRFFAELGGSP